MRFIDELKKLNLPLGKYAIFGSGPLAIRGLRENNDIDIIVTDKLWLDLTKKFSSYKVASNHLRIGHISIFHNWLPWFPDASHLIHEAEIIQGLPFVKLKYVKQWKEQSPSQKDKNDLALLKNTKSLE